MAKQHKILYLYSLLQESGLGCIKCSKLVQELRKHFIVDLRYSIFTDDEYLKIDQYNGTHPDSLRKQVISESNFSEQSYDLIFIEHRLLIESDQKSEKARSEFLKNFRESGGVIILNLAEQIDFLGDKFKPEICNGFLKEVGLPTIRHPGSKEDFPDIHLVGENYKDEIIRGFESEEKNKIKGSYTYYSINVYEFFLEKIDPIFHPIFERVEKLVVNASVQIEVFPNRTLLVGNNTTQMITSGDLRWDASLYHVFGAVNDTFGGCGVTITGYLFTDQIINSQKTDSIRFAVNLINYLISGKEEIPLSEDYSNDQQLIEVSDIKNELNDPRNSLFPMELVQGTRGYIEKVAEQANICYSSHCYDACAVMTRRLIETLIIECFENHKIAQDIKNNGGNYLYLDDLINKFLVAENWTVGRTTKQGLPKLKDIGNHSAHNRRFSARKPDLDKIQSDIRIVVEELVTLGGFDKIK